MKNVLKFPSSFSSAKELMDEVMAEVEEVEPTVILKFPEGEIVKEDEVMDED